MKTVIISRQGEASENYESFLKLVKQKNINVLQVKAGDRIRIDKYVYFDILFPEENLIKENVLNNNSIVAKLVYKNFSVLFTGDIEEIAERRILERYSNTKKLNATILKVAHHGSKSSSTIEFLSVVSPRIALIGVGKNNNFGHPDAYVIERLEDIKTKIYRTDENGEISFEINKRQEILISNMIN